MSAPSLTETLRTLGYTHQRVPGGTGYAHDIVDTSGVVVFTGTANEVWAWVHAGRPRDERPGDGAR